MLHALDILLSLMPGGHDLMTTAHAAQAKICTGTQAQPALFAAGVGLFHGDDVADANVHSGSSFDLIPIDLGGLLQLVGPVFVVAGILNVVGQVLLADPVVRVVVGI